MTKVKICGLKRREDIEAVNRYLPDYIGFLFAKSRRQVTEEQAAELSALLSPAITPVGVFVNEEPERICRIVQAGIIRAVQLHGSEMPAYVNALKRRLESYGTIPVIKAVRMEPGVDLRLWERSDADFLLLDQGAGGTGEAFDHELIGEAGELVKPWFLAGGMSPETAPEAIRRFHPYAVDVSSGVESDGVKDPEKMRRMVEAVRGARR
ncbi:MAG: phosphoribosylanthranilate isomerase [Clostridiales bacterium]|nr:phosphoribosylanthranilate isomerase [Clostridiales bacterium]